MDVLMA